MSSLVASDGPSLRAERWLRWLTRSTGLGACAVSVVFVLAVKGPLWIAGVKGHDVQFFVGILGLTVAYVALPRGTEVDGRPSRWALMAGRAPAEPGNARGLAFLAVGVSVAYLAFAAVCLVLGEVRELSVAYRLGQQVALVWWLFAVLQQWGATWGESNGEATPKVADFNVASWTSAHSLALRSRFGWGFLAMCLVHWLLVHYVGGGAAVSADDDATYWAISAGVAFGSLAVSWLARGGWITIDPSRQEIAWRRPPRGPEATQVWRFDEIQGIRTRGLTKTVVRIDVGTRNLVVKTADSEKAWQLVESLRAETA